MLCCEKCLHSSVTLDNARPHSACLLVNGMKVRPEKPAFCPLVSICVIQELFRGALLLPPALCRVSLLSGGYGLKPPTRISKYCGIHSFAACMFRNASSIPSSQFCRVFWHYITAYICSTSQKKGSREQKELPLGTWVAYFSWCCWPLSIHLEKVCRMWILEVHNSLFHLTSQTYVFFIRLIIFWMKFSSTFPRPNFSIRCHWVPCTC